MCSTGLDQKYMQGEQSQMSVHQKNYFWTQVKLEKRLIPPVLEFKVEVQKWGNQWEFNKKFGKTLSNHDGDG